jgi:hypothetical protein
MSGHESQTGPDIKMESLTVGRNVTLALTSSECVMKRPFGRPRIRWEDDTEIGLRKVEYEDGSGCY